MKSCIVNVSSLKKKTQAPLELLGCQPQFNLEPGNTLKAKPGFPRIGKKKEKKLNVFPSRVDHMRVSENKEGTEQVLGTLNP